MDYSRAIDLQPNDAYFWNNRGHAYAELGRFVEAFDNYDKACSIVPDVRSPSFLSRAVFTSYVVTFLQ